MQDEILKQKYLGLKQQLYNIKNQIDQLDNIYYDLNTVLHDGLFIDDNVVESNNLEVMHNTNTTVLSDIVNTVIYSIDSKI